MSARAVAAGLRSKEVSLGQIVGSLRNGQRIAFGGGGLSRKPMAAVAAIAESRLDELHTIAFLAGPEIDLLVGTGKVASVHFAYFGFDGLGMAPNFRRAREGSGKPCVTESSEALFIGGVEAAARGIPFMPSHSGLFGDLAALPGSPYREFSCPITGTRLIAAPAITSDVLLLHANEADRFGNVWIRGDQFLDPLMARGADAVFVTVDRLVDQLPRPDEMSQSDTVISRVWITGVCEVPAGSGFTASFPDRTADIPALLEYQARATDPTWLAKFVAENGAR